MNVRKFVQYFYSKSINKIIERYIRLRTKKITISTRKGGQYLSQDQINQQPAEQRGLGSIRNEDQSAGQPISRLRGAILAVFETKISQIPWFGYIVRPKVPIFFARLVRSLQRSTAAQATQTQDARDADARQDTIKQMYKHKYHLSFPLSLSPSFSFEIYINWTIGNIIYLVVHATGKNFLNRLQSLEISNFYPLLGAGSTTCIHPPVM